MSNKGPLRLSREQATARGSRAPGPRGSAVDPPSGEPQKPGWLSPAEAAVWSRLAGDLNAAGLLRVSDGELMAVYCSTWVAWRTLQDDIDERGSVERGLHGERIRATAVQAARLSRDLSAMLSAFGLSPAGRARLGPVATSAPAATAAAAAKLARKQRLISMP